MRGAVLLLGLIATTGCGNREQELMANVGKNACNALNGAFRGKILGVMKDPANHSDEWVYRVQRPNTRATYAPVDGSTVTTGKCPDGEP